MHRSLIPALVLSTAPLFAAQSAPVDSVVRLDKMVVSSTRHERSVDQTPGIAYVVDQRDMTTIAASRPSDVLAYVPGIDIQAGTGVGSPTKKTVALNGLPSAHTIVLVDGKRLLSSHFHTGIDIDLIPAGAIERIEVIKDASSALYGSDAAGGVVNIITKKCSAAPALNFSSKVGSMMSVGSELSTQSMVNESVFHSGYVGWDQSKGMLIKNDNRRAGHLQYKQFNLLDRVDIRPTDNGTTIGISVHYLTQNDLRLNATDPKTYDAWLFTPGIDLSVPVNEFLTIAGTGYYTQWNADLSAERHEAAGPQIWGTWTGIENNAITAGVEYLWRNLARTGVVLQDQHATALFLQDEYSPVDALSLVGALRVDYVDNTAEGATDNGPVVSPKLSARYSPIDLLTVRAGIGRAFRAPHVQDLYESRSHRTIWRYGTRTLKPEYSTNGNAGIEVTPLPGLSVLCNGYVSSLTDMIAVIDAGRDTVVNGDSIAVMHRQNVNDFLITSAEVRIAYSLPFLSAEIGGSTTMYASNDSASLKALVNQGQSLHALLSTDLPIVNALRGNAFVGVKSCFNRKATGGAWMPDYTKLQAGAGLKLAGRYEVYVKGDNLLGQEIAVYEDALYTIRGIESIEAGIRVSAF